MRTILGVGSRCLVSACGAPALCRGLWKGVLTWSHGQVLSTIRPPQMRLWNLNWVAGPLTSSSATVTHNSKATFSPGGFCSDRVYLAPTMY